MLQFFKIFENDELTNDICGLCVDKFRQANELRTTCIESDRWLRTNSKTLNIELDVAAVKDEKASEVNEDLMTTPQEVLQTNDNDPNEDSTSESDVNELKTESSNPKRNRQKSLEKTHMCTICGKTFFTSGHLRSHELTHKDSKDFTCNSCGKKFLMKSYLNRHMKSHLNERSYKCKVCQKGFNTSTTLGYHFRLVHSGNNVEIID